MTVRTIGRSLLKYWYVVLGGAVLFAVMAGAISATESTTYAAQSFVYAPSAILAPNTNPVVLDRQLSNTLEFLNAEEIPTRVLSDGNVDMEPAEAGSHVSLSQAPGLDIVIVSATASTSEEAVALAESAAGFYASLLNDQRSEQLDRLDNVLTSSETSVSLTGLDALSIAAIEETARVIGPTSVSGGASNTTQSAVFGGMVGLLFGALVALALGYVKVPADSTREIEELTSLPTLGRVDYSATTPRESGTPDARLELIAATLFDRLAPTGSSAVALVPAREGTNVEQIAQDLARGLAAQGKEIAVVDASDLNSSDGLAQLADAGSDLASVAEQITVGTGALFMLAAGRTNVPFASWLGTPEAVAALSRLRQTCPLTILVAAPVSKDASGLLLASQIGSAVLLVPETMSRTQASKTADEISRMALSYTEVLVISGS